MLFVGVLYVLPPFNFCRRAGGEVVISEAMGLIPVLGAYIVQVGNLTRTVYLASEPLVVATALWVWMDELITRMDDARAGRQTMVILFGPSFSARFITLALSVVFYAAFFLAAVASSIPWWAALIVALLFGLVRRIVALSWKEYDSLPRIIEARKKAFALHLATCQALHHRFHDDGRRGELGPEDEPSFDGAGAGDGARPLPENDVQPGDRGGALDVSPSAHRRWKRVEHERDQQAPEHLERQHPRRNVTPERRLRRRAHHAVHQSGLEWILRARIAHAHDSDTTSSGISVFGSWHGASCAHWSSCSAVREGRGDGTAPQGER